MQVLKNSEVAIAAHTPRVLKGHFVAVNKMARYTSGLNNRAYNDLLEQGPMGAFTPWQKS
jgi:hypothetical protein